MHIFSEAFQTPQDSFIFTVQPGDKVEFSQPFWGLDDDILQADRLGLEKGTVLTLKGKQIQEVNTVFWFEEYPDQAFNSVMFDAPTVH